MNAQQVLTQALNLLQTGEQLFAEEAVKCVELRHAVSTNALEVLALAPGNEQERLQNAINMAPYAVVHDATPVALAA